MHPQQREGIGIAAGNNLINDVLVGKYWHGVSSCDQLINKSNKIIVSARSYFPLASSIHPE